MQPMVSLEMSSLSVGQVYKLLIGSIIPRPIALVSTRSREGVSNLAPFSFFNGVASAPPSMMFSVSRKPDGSKKDTLLNIEATRQWVVNICSHSMAEKVNQTSAEYPFGVSEFDKAGFTEVASLQVNPPRVAESPIHMECELYQTMEVGEGGAGSATIVVGKILRMHVREQAYKDGKILLDEIAPLSRLAGLNYGLTSGVFELPRPKC